MSYRVIRISPDKEIVLLVMPFDATPWSAGCRFFLRDPQVVSEAEALDFQEVGEDVARKYCDNMGRDGLPEQPFTDFDDVRRWLSQKPAEESPTATC